MELGVGEEQILFVGHYDTVYEKGAFGEVWKEEGNKIKGPGVLDMKGGNIQVYMIAKELKELNLFPNNKKTVFFLSSDEEAGSYSSYKHFQNIAKESKAAFVMESTKGDYTGGLKIGRYGRGNYTINAKGKPAHSGQEPEKAESSLIELAQQAIYLENLSDYKSNQKVTIACTCLKSGASGWPTVPGEGKLTIDARFATAYLSHKYDEIIQNVTSLIPTIELTIKGGIEKPPYNEKEHKHQNLYEKAKLIGEKFNLNMKGIVTRGGSDGNFTSSVGCPTIDGLGMSGDFVHQPGREYINTDNIALRTAFVARLALEVLNSEEESNG